MSNDNWVVISAKMQALIEVRDEVVKRIVDNAWHTPTESILAAMHAHQSQGMRVALQIIDKNIESYKMRANINEAAE